MDAVATAVHELQATGGGQQADAARGANATTFDVANFQNALAEFDPGNIDAAQVQPSDAQTKTEQTASPEMWPAVRNMGEAALNLSDQAGSVRSDAFEALAKSDELSPQEMISLQVEVQKFSFHAQLSSNVANRSSQGIQELFRQQL